MAAPSITITSISTTKIGQQPDKDRSVVTFIADQELRDFEARAGGIGPGSGLLVGKAYNSVYTSSSLYPSDSLYPLSYALPTGVEQQFEIDNEELQQDGEYRINVYGMNEAGEWTAYE